MLLTDLDGIVFELPQGSVKKVKRHRQYCTIITKMNDRFKVKEDIEHIIYLALKEGEKKNDGL